MKIQHIHLFQVKQRIIENESKYTSTSSRLLRLRQSKTDINLEFKPLVQVDPSVLPSTRVPLRNPRMGDYQLKQTASTEGIASKKSLELKKRYLLGETVLTTGIMKSDSTSILDSKLKNFHSNISGCQKLLNTPPDISPALQTFLKNTISCDVDNLIGPSVESSKVIHVECCEEKENVYDQIVNSKNELNKSDISEARRSKNFGNLEVSNDVIHINTHESPANAIERIDLVSPEKREISIYSSASVNENCRFDVSDNKIKIIQVENCNVKNTDVFIDLTGDTSLEELPNITEPDELQCNSITKLRNEIEQTKMSDDSFEQPNILNKVGISNRMLQESESNSSKSSSNTSSSCSPADIPHHILESTTNTSADATPIASNNELMQMDSLMIIDGKYTGDPEDLKHIKMPDIMRNEYKSVEHHLKPKATEISESLNVESAKPIIKAYKYESIYKRPELKFDTKNENKIYSLRNLPLILPKQIEQTAANVTKGLTLNIIDKDNSNLSDNDKTPTVADPGDLGSLDRATAEEALNKSDSETETTGCMCTETELSDWTADDAVSENFVDIEFALNSNKGTLKRNRRTRSKMQKTVAANHPTPNKSEQKNHCPIAAYLDFDGIEFMDTGSEESYMETYAATNDAMLKNRGYVKFVNTNAPDPKKDIYSYEIDSEKTENEIARDENIRDKMGSVEFIEQGACILDKHINLNILNENSFKIPIRPIQIKSEGNDASLNELEDDSLAIISSHGGGNTTTEESEPLTIVTSPLEPPRNIKLDKIEKPKTFQNNSSDAADLDMTPNKYSDDITYEDYVRQLQMAITQISNARDSIDIRKMKRKHSKSEISAGELNTSVQTGQQHQQNPQQSPYTVIDKHNKSSNKSLSIYVSKTVEPTTTVIEKLEEITKERTKQKDLIHDLVMNKLQSKKQLNAEKRLNRSRSRALSLSPCTNVLPPLPPKVTTSNTSPTKSEIKCTQNRLISSAVAEELNCDYGSRKSAKNDDSKPKNMLRGNQRPLSDNVDIYFETPKLVKTKSFCAYERKSSSKAEQKNKSPIKSAAHYKSRFGPNVNTFSTPLIASCRKPDDVLCQSTDELRQDARLRARLMSNQELGLSPEDKINLLRKSYKSDNAKNAPKSFAHQNVSDFTHPFSHPNKSDDMKVRDRKMLASKSVNDIAATNLVLDCDSRSDGNHTTFDFTSDSNLLNDKPKKRRQKDPERRKSIIQAVSEFFHKKKEKEQPASPKEKTDSVFGLFRISPKTKSKVIFVVL